MGFLLTCTPFFLGLCACLMMMMLSDFQQDEPQAAAFRRAIIFSSL